MELDSYRVLSFDCYGTLVDWETGIVEALEPVLERHGVRLERDTLLELYAELERRAESGDYTRYAEVLRRVVRRMGEALDFEPSDDEVDCLVDSIGDWPPFEDAVPALKSLRNRYRLAVLSNVDDDLFAATASRLAVDFDWVVTAEQVGSYKPSLDNFRHALETIGRPADEVLHVAQSLYHDIAPANELDLATVWVNRRGDRQGTGATPPAAARPDLEVPDLLTLVAAVNT